ncbi:MAG: argininosuccinate synthase [Planctomycetota bacterium]|jgi:argininosuccinate synthase
MNSYDKIVLAYSGGLDTTVAIPWLKKQTGAEIVAFGVDVGQPEDLVSATERALAAGAAHASFLDAKVEFATGFLIPAIKANALYEGIYPLLSALSRPLIVEKLVASAVAEGADAIAHGCTGKGNDQVRFELSLAALAPNLPVLAPARVWGFTRDDSLQYANSLGLPLAAGNGTPYSIDENLWGRAVECGDLEDPWIEPPPEAFALTADPKSAPAEPLEITVDFVRGTPSALNGIPMDPLALIVQVGEWAGEHGIGRIDHVENRTVGIKSREIYECPAATVLLTAHKALEAMVLTKEVSRFKTRVDARWAELIYEGKWHTPLKQALDAFIETTQVSVTGSVRLKMFKGALAVVGRKSPWSLYDEDLATYGEGDPFDHAASEGFIRISSMEISTLARANPMVSPLLEVPDHASAPLAQPVA